MGWVVTGRDPDPGQGTGTQRDLHPRRGRRAEGRPPGPLLPELTKTPILAKQATTTARPTTKRIGWCCLAKSIQRQCQSVFKQDKINVKIQFLGSSKLILFC